MCEDATKVGFQLK